MLLRLISAISLMVFALLMISGMQTELAIYRSLIVFLILFAGIYLTIFFINIIRESSGHHSTSPPASVSSTTFSTRNSAKPVEKQEKSEQ
ncbi:MAG: hypothetical protein WD097_03265 [Balneolales bacterium]